MERNMFKINENYLKLPGSYLFSTIGKKVAAYTEANPDKSIIRLGIGDVTQPLAPAIIDSLHSAVDEMAHAETFHGYAPDLGYEFLRGAMAKQDYQARGCDISADEVFISDGAKCDSGNIQEIFSIDNKIAVCDPVYPVYVDTNIMCGNEVTYLPGNAENDFLPLPDKSVKADIIYLCSHNNPTGAVYNKEQLKAWVDYANENNAVILFDSAYECFITDENLPRSIYEIEGAKTCAIEFCSLSKMAGFTGTRLAILSSDFYGKNFEVYIDGEKIDSIKTNKNVSPYGVSYLSTKLEDKKHSVVIKCRGEANIDSIATYTEV